MTTLTVSKLVPGYTLTVAYQPGKPATITAKNTLSGTPVPLAKAAQAKGVTEAMLRTAVMAATTKYRVQENSLTNRKATALMHDLIRHNGGGEEMVQAYDRLMARR